MNAAEQREDIVPRQAEIKIGKFWKKFKEALQVELKRDDTRVTKPDRSRGIFGDAVLWDIMRIIWVNMWPEK